VYIHPTAEVSEKAEIGENTKIWHGAQIRENAKIGDNCIIGKDVYIDIGVIIGSNVKIQNGAYIYYETKIEDSVFIGPNVCFTNDKVPRAVTAFGSLKTDDDWVAGKILVREGASIGANSVILPDVTIGRFAMIGAGSVVTKDVPDYGLVYGNPAKLKGFVCKCGKTLEEIGRKESFSIFRCTKCGEEIRLEMP
jgi:acetyltransferase-like isoleucine patch superfamily enzyme